MADAEHPDQNNDSRFLGTFMAGSDGKQAEQTVGTVLIPSACVSVWAVVRWMQSFHYHDYGTQ